MKKTYEQPELLLCELVSADSFAAGVSIPDDAVNEGEFGEW